MNHYFAKLQKKKYNFGVIHLADEYLTAPTWYYKHAKFVFRNYWNKNYKRKNVAFFALGYKKGFWADGKKDLLLAKNRRKAK